MTPNMSDQHAMNGSTDRKTAEQNIDRRTGARSRVPLTSRNRQSELISVFLLKQTNRHQSAHMVDHQSPAQARTRYCDSLNAAATRDVSSKHVATAPLAAEPTVWYTAIPTLENRNMFRVYQDPLLKCGLLCRWVVGLAHPYISA